MSLRVANNVLELIGNTPMVRLAKIDKDYPFEIWAKCEFMNPTGSVKDRMAYYIITVSYTHLTLPTTERV